MVMEARNVEQSQNTVPWSNESRRVQAKGGHAEARRRADPGIPRAMIVELYSK